MTTNLRDSANCSHWPNTCDFVNVFKPVSGEEPRRRTVVASQLVPAHRAQWIRWGKSEGRVPVRSSCCLRVVHS
jgi:hypothetical protein